MKAEKTDVYKLVTDKVIEALEAGVSPWKRSWRSAKNGQLCNAISKKPYRGVNILLLSISSAVNGFPDPRWLTYKNAVALGGNVKKGEKGTQIIFWNFFKSTDGTKTNADGTPKEKTVPFARAYTVFNVAQCENINIEALVEDDTPVLVDDINDSAERILSLATVRHGGDRACFSPAADVIMMPERTAFYSPEEYYATGYHEIVHWTGAKKRLDRDFTGRYGSESYAFEELVAEMGAAFLGAHTSLPFDGMRHPEYIASWLETLRNDVRAVFTAASKAQAATDYVLKNAGLVVEEEETQAP